MSILTTSEPDACVKVMMIVAIVYLYVYLVLDIAHGPEIQYKYYEGIHKAKFKTKN